MKLVIIKSLIIILLVLVVAILLKIRQYFKRKKAFKLVEELSQKQVDQVVEEALINCGLLKKQAGLTSNVISEIWGQGVLAFSYEVQLREELSDLAECQREFMSQLKLASESKNLQGLPGYPSVMVTDFWLEEKTLLHIDVANIVNKATAQYVHDIKKVE